MNCVTRCFFWCYCRIFLPSVVLHRMLLPRFSVTQFLAVGHIAILVLAPHCQYTAGQYLLVPDFVKWSSSSTQLRYPRLKIYSPRFKVIESLGCSTKKNRMVVIVRMRHGLSLGVFAIHHIFDTFSGKNSPGKIETYTEGAFFPVSRKRGINGLLFLKARCI